MEMETEMFSLDATMQILASEVLETNTNVLARKSSIRIHIIIEKDPSPQRTVDFADFIRVNRRSRLEEHKLARRVGLKWLINDSGQVRLRAVIVSMTHVVIDRERMSKPLARNSSATPRRSG